MDVTCSTDVVCHAAWIDIYHWELLEQNKEYSKIVVFDKPLLHTEVLAQSYKFILIFSNCCSQKTNVILFSLGGLVLKS